MSLGSILASVGQFVPGLGGGPSGNDDGAEAAKAEEARKAALRSRINTFYGIGPNGARPAMTPVADDSKGLLGKSLLVSSKAAGGDAAGQAYDANSAEAKAASDELAGEDTQLTRATRHYYADQLSRGYRKAERQTRFALARQGLLGGSADVDEHADLSSDRDLGATRVDEAVRRALASLTGQRENERMGAINLVNSGAGEDAVISAQRGLKNAYDTANSQEKVNLFGDLFGSASDAVSNSNLAQQQAAFAARYQNGLSTFFPNTPKPARVT